MPRQKYLNKSADEILSLKHEFSSDWYIFQALSWFDYAKRKLSFSALSFCALEIRMGIEQLWFEILFLNLGGKVDTKNYKKCTNQAQNMYKLIHKLAPDYEKLVKFSKIALSLDHNSPNIAEWDLKKLEKYHGLVSDYLHFKGIPNKLEDFNERYDIAVSKLGEILNYIEKVMKNSSTGVMNPNNMENEVNAIWLMYKNDEISDDVVRNQLKIIFPILHRRLIQTQLQNKT